MRAGEVILNELKMLTQKYFIDLTNAIRIEARKLPEDILKLYTTEEGDHSCIDIEKLAKAAGIGANLLLGGNNINPKDSHDEFQSLHAALDKYNIIKQCNDIFEKPKNDNAETIRHFKETLEAENKRTILKVRRVTLDQQTSEDQNTSGALSALSTFASAVTYIAKANHVSRGENYLSKVDRLVSEYQEALRERKAARLEQLNQYGSSETRQMRK